MTDSSANGHAHGDDRAPGVPAHADDVGAVYGEAPDGVGDRAEVGDGVGARVPAGAERDAAYGTDVHDTAARAGDPAEVVRGAARRAIEALVLVAEQPLTTHLLGQLLEMAPVIVDRLCRELAEEYEEQGRGFQLVEVAGGWRYQSHPDQAPYVERLVLEGQTAKLSAAALETLAIVAYKQPISRAQVAAIRGVSVDGVMRTLQQRGYIAEVAKDPGPGQAVLFGTTRMFLEKLGLNTADELPPLGDFVPGADVVEQLERGLRPDRDPWRPEDAFPTQDGDAEPAFDDGFDRDTELDARPDFDRDSDVGSGAGSDFDRDSDAGFDAESPLDTDEE